jgi:hypothetical protein
MQIKTKYNIGDRVWVVKEADYYNTETRQRELAGVLEVFDDYIESIQVYNEGVIYVLRQADMLELYEHEVILYDNKEGLVKKIEKVMEIINKRENRNLQSS